MNCQERRTDLAMRRRVDDLLDRVRAARDEIVETGLSAVRGDGGAGEARGDARAAGRSRATCAGY